MECCLGGERVGSYLSLDPCKAKRFTESTMRCGEPPIWIQQTFDTFMSHVSESARLPRLRAQQSIRLDLMLPVSVLTSPPGCQRCPRRHRHCVKGRVA